MLKTRIASVDADILKTLQCGHWLNATEIKFLMGYEGSRSYFNDRLVRLANCGASLVRENPVEGLPRQFCSLKAIDSTLADMRMRSMDQTAFISQVDVFLRDNPEISATSFGRKFMSDPNFIRKLRAGRNTTLETVEKLHGQMQKYEKAKAQSTKVKKLSIKKPTKAQMRSLW